MKYISVVVPLYKCSSFIPELVERLELVLAKINPDYEILFVNDASPENDWDVVRKIAENNNKIKGISLSRNFGQHYAIAAGLSIVKSEWIVVMDGDLQDVPEGIENLHNKALEGYDIVQARRIERKDKFLKKLSSKLFYKLFGYLTDTEQDSLIGNYGIYYHKVITSINNLGDSIRFFPTLINYVGFKKTALNVSHGKRSSGVSSYSLKALLVLSFNNIIAFSDKPLRLTLKFGGLIVLMSFLYAFYTLYLYFVGEVTVTGYTTLVLSVWFLSGVIIFILGIIGLYLGKTFDKVKDRPSYIINSKVNLND